MKMEFGMNVAEDFEKMTDQFRGDYQNRIATIRGLFKDTRQLLAPIRPQLKRQTQGMLTEFRAGHKKMTTEMHQLLKETVRRIKSETNKMMQTYHGQSNHRQAQCKQMHGSAQAFLKAMAQARHMHPLSGRQTDEATPVKKHPRRRKKTQAAA
jgi:uncharacterized protein YukE